MGNGQKIQNKYQLTKEIFELDRFTKFIKIRYIMYCLKLSVLFALFLMVLALCEGSYQWKQGDGDSPDGPDQHEEYIGEANDRHKCLSLVKQLRPSANGVTFGRHGGGRYKECYAEYKWNGVATIHKYPFCDWCKEYVTRKI